MTKLEAMKEAGRLLKSEQIPHHLEARFNAGKGITLLSDVDCIHLTWFLDNALGEVQASCTFYEKWVDIQGFPDVGGELADVAKGRLSAKGAFQQVLDKGRNGAL